MVLIRALLYVRKRGDLFYVTKKKVYFIKRYTERNTKRQIYRKITDNTAEAYLGPFQTSKNELFTKIINGF